MLILLAYTALALSPVALIVMNSFKGRKAIFKTPYALPNKETWDLIGYEKVLDRADFLLYFRNSFVVTGGALLLIMVAGTMAAWALAEYRFPGNGFMGLYLALGIMIPIRLGTVSILRLCVDLGIVDTLWALILVYTASGLPLAVFILTNFMKQVPRDLKDAARVDGASEYRIYYDDPAAGAPGHWHGYGLQHDPDLERPVVPVDPGSVGTQQNGHAGRAGLSRPVYQRLERRTGLAVTGADPNGCSVYHFLAAVDPGADRRRREVIWVE